MRGARAAAAMLAVLLLAAPARAGRAPGDAAAIQTVIESQLDAFRRDDADGAFSFAAPGIQHLFGNPAAFMAIVRRSYRPVYRPRSVDFTSLVDEGGALVQSVELLGPDGLPYTARYTMEREADGSWRISACELLPSRRLGA